MVSQAAAPSDRDVPRVSVPEGQATQLPGTETISAEAELLGLKAGTLEWVSSGACPAKGRPLGTARASLHTAGVIRWFKRSDGAASTILDPKSSFPIEQEMRVNDSGEQRRYQLKFSPGQFHYVYERDGQAPQEATKPVPLGDRAYDVQSAFLLLRAWRPEPRERGYFHVVLGRTLWRSEVLFVGSEMLELDDDKKVPALRIDGVARKVKTDPKDDTEPRNFVLWFAPDERRTPLRIVADGKYGALLLTMTSHRLEPDRGCVVAPEPVLASPVKKPPPAAGDADRAGRAGPSRATGTERPRDPGTAPTDAPVDAGASTEKAPPASDAAAAPRAADDAAPPPGGGDTAKASDASALPKPPPGP
ncbi:MAG TPA: DUF3108 domain-containing protein [Polyangiaceae bacterium]|nr:DUF3108 domain-containing protein [Polyangiaceae bacterium]